MPITTPATNTDLQADAAPGGPLCPNPTCRQPLIPHTRQFIIGHYPVDEVDCWLCLNTIAHGGKPSTAAIWLDSELTEPMTEAEARALELIVPWGADS